MTEPAQTLPRATWLWFAILTLGWGFNWPMMKIAVGEVSVWTFRSLCVGAGALGMFAIAAANRQRLLPPPGQWVRVALTAVFNVTGWNLLIGFGLTLLPAGRAVILAYTMPLWVQLLIGPVLGERLTRRGVLGLALGMAAMALLLSNEFAVLRNAPAGALLVVGAAFSWALGTVLTKRYPANMPTTSYTAWQMLFGGLPVMLGAILLDHAPLHAVSPVAMVAIAYNMLIAFILCYWAWYKIVASAPAAVSALGTLMIPVVGVFSSAWLLGERPGLPDYVGLALVIAAIATVIVPAGGRAQAAPRPAVSR